MSFGDSLYTLTFYAFVLLTVFSAIIVAMSRSIVYSAFALLVTFFGVAGIYVFLTAEFLAIAQIVIYIGGIMVLFLFAIMLTRNIKDVNLANPVAPGYVAAPLVLIIYVGLILLIMKTPWKVLPSANIGTVREIGNVLLGKYLLVFEIAAVLLLAVLLGAAYLARRPKK